MAVRILKEGAQFGGIWSREFIADFKGDVHEGHEHNEDHVTVLYTGGLKIETRLGTYEYPAPARINIRAELWHRLTALANNTRWSCDFAVSDKPGAYDEKPVKDTDHPSICDGCPGCDGMRSMSLEGA